MINGVNLNDMVQNQVTFQPTINTVSEFKIDNSTYSAEFGRNSGSTCEHRYAFRFVDHFHGEAYDYLRKQLLRRPGISSIRYSHRSGRPQSARPPSNGTQFGGDFGGPIFKGKTFFFLSYEGLRQRQGLPTTSAVLTDAERTQIQTSGSPSARGLLQFVPAANGTLNGAPTFFGSASANVNIDQGTVDISHNFSEGGQDSRLLRESTRQAPGTYTGFQSARLWRHSRGCSGRFSRWARLTFSALS